MSLAIRRVRPEEYDDAGDLIVASYGHNDYLVLPDGRYDDDYAAELHAVDRRDRDAEVWVVLDGDEILGCVTWCPIGSSYREVSVADDQAEFRGLAVAPAARGRGAGRAIVQWCLRRARDEFFTEVVICSLPEMQPAHRLYESLGFTRRPDLDWSPIKGVVLWGFSAAL